MMSPLRMLKVLKTQLTLVQSESKVKVICKSAVSRTQYMGSIVTTFKR